MFLDACAISDTGLRSFTNFARLRKKNVTQVIKSSICNSLLGHT